MITKICFLVFVAVLGSAPRAEACVANAVLNLRIHVGGNLTWTVNPNEPCTIDYFKVEAQGDRQDDYVVNVRDHYVDLSFLKTCEQWKFHVTPVSEGVLGHETRIIDWIPIPSNADLTLEYFNVTVRKKNDVLLKWDLRNHTHGDCTLEYRVAIVDRDTSKTRDVYLTGKSAHIDFLSPCVPYRLTMRAVNTAIGGIEGPLAVRNLEIPAYPEDPPELRNIQIYANRISMSWRLENYLLNRCPIINFYVDGGNAFNISVPVMDPEGRPPVHVNVTGLQPSTIYSFKVYVENSAGVSTAVPMAVQTATLG
ncbi:hypothetical protein NQ315_001409 [Exocentrus adspersus]|uniref:Fibronectin type-III domain-containing protein n=1 Tax=Exocentrus adspersus TaxID=1586481 RepID=A0AAV8WF74_9CUCU|nr:hypothetical protein NQ315_001409 [Exocentrus adspersus]